MTAINENGQVYWTFEELDFEGALQETLSDLNCLFFMMESETISDSEWKKLDRRVDRLIQISLYLERLKRGQRYV